VWHTPGRGIAVYCFQPLAGKESAQLVVVVAREEFPQVLSGFAIG
jgi:hypothetical protein